MGPPDGVCDWGLAGQASPSQAFFQTGGGHFLQGRSGPSRFPDQCGVAGFCMGGALSIASSVLLPDVDAVVAFYGVPPSELAKAKAPVQAHFGELDSFIGFSDVTLLLCYGITDNSWKEVAMKLRVKSGDGAVSDAIHELVANG